MEQKNKTLTLGSLFDGSGGFPLGGVLAGITPIFNSEIEPFPVRVTEVRFPNMKHYGDVSKLKGAELPPVDVITFGSPCQDMSIAGCRDGLSGSRSSLFYEAIRIIKEMREATNGQYPRYIVWENVPGAFSSNKGEDFRAVLEEVCKVKDSQVSVSKPSKWENAGRIMGDSYSIAWRLFDAQYWGVPQRRQRIYLVADFDGGSAGKILFESEGVSGYSAESFRAWQTAAGCSEEGTGETGRICLNDQGGNRMDVTEDVTCTLRAEAHHPPVALEHHPTDSRIKIADDDKSQTLTSRMGTGGNNVPLIMECFGICSKDSNSMKSDNPKSGFYIAKTSRTLDANGGNPTCNQGGIAVVEGNGSRPSHHGDGYREDDVMYTLNATEQHGVAFAEPKTLKIRCGKEGGGKGALVQDNKSATLSCNNDQTLFEPTWSASKASFFTCPAEEVAGALVATDYKDPPLVNDSDGCEYIVRRLTPTECARLQGFPDWWCNGLETPEPSEQDIESWKEVFETHRKVITGAAKPKTDAQIIRWLKDPHSDSAEYKMWGNGVALPNVVFVLAGIAYFSEYM